MRFLPTSQSCPQLTKKKPTCAPIRLGCVWYAMCGVVPKVGGGVISRCSWWLHGVRQGCGLSLLSWHTTLAALVGRRWGCSWLRGVRLWHNCCRWWWWWRWWLFYAWCCVTFFPGCCCCCCCCYCCCCWRQCRSAVAGRSCTISFTVCIRCCCLCCCFVGDGGLVFSFAWDDTTRRRKRRLGLL